MPWNVRGAVTPSSKDMIDDDLDTRADIVALHEPHLPSGLALTKHVEWHCSGGTGSTTTRREDSRYSSPKRTSSN